MAKTGPKLIGIQQDINPFSLMEDYLIKKRGQGVTQFTVTSHRSALRNFFAEYKGNIKDVRKLKQASYLFLSDMKAGYYNKVLQALRQFFEFLIAEGIIKENPCSDMRYKRSNVRIVHHEEAVLKAFLELPDRTSFAGQRDYAIALTILDNGIRPNELLQVTVKDIDFLNGYILIREEVSKTRQPRTVPISPRTVSVIKKVINSRHPDWDNDVPVFCSFSGHRLTSHNLQERFRAYGEKLGVNVSPYSLRHSFALMFVRNSGNIFALQRIMGHSKLDMTRTYVDLVAADVKNSHAHASPLKILFDSEARVGKLNTTSK